MYPVSPATSKAASVQLHQPPQKSQRQSHKQIFRRAAVTRNLRTAAVLGAAVSGSLISMGWMAVTASTTFTVLYIWRLMQLRRPTGQSACDELIG